MTKKTTEPGIVERLGALQAEGKSLDEVIAILLEEGLLEADQVDQFRSLYE